MERNCAQHLEKRDRERGGDRLLRHYQGFHLGTRIPARWDSLPHYGRGGGRAVHHVGSQPCGRGEDSLHEQRPRRVQGRQGLRCSYDDEGGAVRVLQRLRAQLHAARFLEHRSLDHLRAVQSLREEAEPVNNRTSLYRSIWAHLRRFTYTNTKHS